MLVWAPAAAAEPDDAYYLMACTRTTSTPQGVTTAEFTRSVTHHPDELPTLRGQLRLQPFINGVLADLVSLLGSVSVPRVVNHSTVIELGL